MKHKQVGDLPQDKMLFVHLSQEIYENIAGPQEDNQVIDVLRKLPLNQSVPMMMQIVLNCSVVEIADYLKISRQTVYKKNKCSLEILKTYLF
jgi:hypothetical protein